MDLSRRVDFVDRFSGRSGRPYQLCLGSVGPTAQPVEAVAAWVSQCVVRTRDVPVEGHRPVEY